MADKVIECIDCHLDFVHSEGAQKFYVSKGFTADPKRCPECRKVKKAESGQVPTGQKGQRELYKATCSDCGGEAEVPFKPKGDRPVFCRGCHNAKKQGA